MAVLLTLLATTELHVREQGCWEGGASQCRVQVFGSAVKLEGRVVANAMLREFDLAAPNPRDQRRLEILVGGSPLLGGAKLAT